MEFEYKIVEVRDLDGVNSIESFEARLNSYGAEGWQLCPSLDPSVLIFMRQKLNGNSQVAELLAEQGFGE